MQAQLAFVLLERIGDPRAKDVHNFGWEVLNPTWSTTFVDNDSGISVMHFMEGFYGELTDLDENRMNEVPCLVFGPTFLNIYTFRNRFCLCHCSIGSEEDDGPNKNDRNHCFQLR